MSFNHLSVKTGCLPKKHDARNLKISSYLDRLQLPTPPDNVDWTLKVSDWGMLGNDKVGNCVVCGGFHLIMGWRANAGLAPLIPTEAEADACYSAVGGYDPSQTDANGYNPTDQGLNVLDFLKYWKNTGILIGGQLHKIVAFAEVNLANDLEVKQTLWIFGGLMTGFAMPLSAEDQPTWTVPSKGPIGKGRPGSWGGHCAPLAAEDSNGNFKVESWGQTLQASGPFVTDYLTEAYAIVSPEWISSNQQTPSGVDLAGMLADQAAL